MHALAVAVALMAVPADSQQSVPLPGGPPVDMDYLAYDPGSHRLFIPAGNTGKVDVLDTRSGKLSSIDGWPTIQAGNRMPGPSAATVGGGYLYVGNRADSSICAVELASLARKGCVALPSAPDGVFFVAPTREVWVTLPRQGSLQVLGLADPAAPALAGTIALEGEPEGYAVDEQRGLVFTNLKDKDKTLVLDARTRKTLAAHDLGCGPPGPRGIAVDPEKRLLFVACSAGGVKALDAAGKIAGEVKTGPGVDNIDYLPARRRVYIASGKEGTLTIAEAAANGALKSVFTARTAPGGRTVIVDGQGTAYIPDAKEGRLVVIRPP
jgi:DNA-binding beta-propeller fold protein YncE